jgi:hypothetical protein
MQQQHSGKIDKFLYALLALVMAFCALCGLGGCSKIAKVAPWAMICIQNKAPFNGKPNTLRASDESCSTHPNEYHWLYVQQTDVDYDGCPPVAHQLTSELMDGTVTTALKPPVPVEQIGFVPYNGGKAIAPPA